MKNLRRYIRSTLLTEVCAGATAQIQKGLDVIEQRDLRVEVYIDGNDGYDVILVSGDGIRRGRFEVTTVKNCPAYSTMWTEVDWNLKKTGVGAVMYDIAVEVATKLGGHLACDRGSVSDSAKRMWRYYTSSDDYEAFQLDTPDSTFTPIKSDDCQQYIFHRETKLYSGDEGFEQEFMASPFTKAFRKKKITTIPCLGNRYSEIRV
tara:strand:- start:620 stop:1234 length:615 start_codon:yes stop_codon:yes gene_type:complete